MTNSPAILFQMAAFKATLPNAYSAIQDTVWIVSQNSVL